jgi:hypothetical protein
MTDTLCVCGHAAEPHTHHRDGRDCSRCGRELCPEFRPLTWWRRVLHRCGWYPAPLPDPVPAVDFTSLFTPARFQQPSPLARGGASVGTWVMLDEPPGVIGEVVDVDHLGVLCEVRVPGAADNRVVLCERVQVIA